MTVTIERLGHLGDGIAPGPVHVARALPGEEVDGTVEDGRIARPKILRPSPRRVRPPCPRYGSCGGCALQHADDAFVADWKVDVVRRALAAQGLPAPIRGISTSPPNSRRRAVLSGRRVRSGGLVGFHAAGSATITAPEGCTVLAPGLMAALPALGEVTRLAASRSSEIKLHACLSEGGLDLAITGARPLERELAAEAAALAGRAGLARLTWNGETVAQSAPPAQRFGRARVVPPPGAFLQATAEGEAALVACVRAALGESRRVADLFAGCGTFTFPLAEAAAVEAVEGDAALVAALEAGARSASGLKPVGASVRDLFRRPLDAAELAGFDGVVIDPPRAGAAAQTAALAESGVQRIAAVSCNPVTFARDARLLVDAGFELARIDVVDQFRWSVHIELVAAFVRAHTR